ncbi:MAG TPA: hypothetical protein DCS93_32180 [Microscillaceae bacterium]|nr:hypothetical protein [Microscillaceae bacterium]
MKNILLVVACGVLTIGVQAQSKFRVLASSGKNTIAGKNKKLYVGNSLAGNQNVNVSSRSYLSLVHKSGGTVQISKAGTYNIASLEQKLATKRKSATGRYVTYVISELTKNGNQNINANRYKYMNVTGSVKRATFNAFSVYLPESSNFYQPKITISWQALVGTKNYLLKITDRFEEKVFYTKTLTDTITTVDFSQGQLKNAQDFLIVIESKERKIKSDKYGLFRLDEEDAPKFNKAYASFKNTNTEGDEASQKLSEAFFFEDKGFYTDALRCYKTAAKIANNADAYVVALKQFLVRRDMGQVPEEDQKKD